MNKFNNLFLATVHEKHCQNFSSTEGTFTKYDFNPSFSNNLRVCANKLKRHALSHKEVPNFKCDFQNCNKVFKRNNCLKAHKLIDSSETKFTCDWNQCLRKFKIITRAENYY